MPYKDPDKAKEAARGRKRRWRARHRSPNWSDGRGRHSNHQHGPNHPRWNPGRMISSHGYVKVRVGKDHPLADPNGYAYEHLLVLAGMGAFLEGGQVTHHRNGERTDNRPENLATITRGQHNKEHPQPQGPGGRFVPIPPHRAGGPARIDGQEYKGVP